MMTRPRITQIGLCTFAEFDRLCRRIVLEMARGIRADAKKTVEVMSKTGYDGTVDGDVVTAADLHSQKRFVDFVQTKFPAELGLIGEENKLLQPSTFDGYSVVLTADPLDGTRAFVRMLQQENCTLLPGQVSVMLGLLIDNEPVAGYICDVSDLTTYLRAPYGKTIWRVDEFGSMINMATRPRSSSLAEGALLWHGRRPVTGPLAQSLTTTSAFARVERIGGSIGLSAMRVFDGEFVGMMRSAGGHTTPWDDTPVQAMCREGGVVVLRIDDDCFQEVWLGPLDEMTSQEHDLLYVPRSFLPELELHAPVHVFS